MQITAEEVCRWAVGLEGWGGVGEVRYSVSRFHSVFLSVLLQHSVYCVLVWRGSRMTVPAEDMDIMATMWLKFF